MCGGVPQSYSVNHICAIILDDRPYNIEFGREEFVAIDCRLYHTWPDVDSLYRRDQDTLQSEATSWV